MNTNGNCALAIAQHSIQHLPAMDSHSSSNTNVPTRSKKKRTIVLKRKKNQDDDLHNQSSRERTALENSEAVNGSGKLSSSSKKIVKRVWPILIKPTKGSQPCTKLSLQDSQNSASDVKIDFQLDVKGHGAERFSCKREILETFAVEGKAKSKNEGTQSQRNNAHILNQATSDAIEMEIDARLEKAASQQANRFGTETSGENRSSVYLPKTEMNGQNEQNRVDQLEARLTEVENMFWSAMEEIRRAIGMNPSS